MLSWNEINELAYVNRRKYEEEWNYRKCYENLLPTIDKLYDYFLLWCWGKGFHNIAKQNSKQLWEHFCIEEKLEDYNIIKDWIMLLEKSKCAKELQRYFNQKIKNTPPYVYKGDSI